ncbi:MAG: hypothetical protein M9887_07665 [Chitinophagales bacterium]|nr:hypothetical protein [Chitinophagales bacterium]
MVVKFFQQIGVWLCMLTFLSSTIGMPLYSHVCHELNEQILSLASEKTCHEEERAKSCCADDKKSESSDCCDIHFKFDKYVPTTDIQQLNVVKKLVASIQIPFFFQQNIQVFKDEEGAAFQARPPNDYLKYPQKLSTRLAKLQSYLC